MVTAALINPSQLRWARERAGVDRIDAADALGIAEERLADWESGQLKPTFRQAQALANTFHTPFGYLFLHEPPAEPLPLPDLRTLGGSQTRPPSLALLDTARQALQRQAWYIDYQREHEAAPLPFVGRFRLHDATAQQIADDMRAVLEIDTRVPRIAADRLFNSVVDAAERIGVLVMRSGIVGNNTHRKLDVAEFRGFAIADRLAPVVFVNLTDAPTARLFTLVHELAHIWLGESGVSDVLPENAVQLEQLCNAAAGEFLVPKAVLVPAWESAGTNASTRAAFFSQRFQVSRLVVMRRAFDLGLVDRQTYWSHYQAELAAFRAQDRGGGSFYGNANNKNSVRLARAVVREALSGRMLLRDAGMLLGVNPAKLKTYAERLKT